MFEAGRVAVPSDFAHQRNGDIAWGFVVFDVDVKGTVFLEILENL